MDVVVNSMPIVWYEAPILVLDICLNLFGASGYFDLQAFYLFWVFYSFGGVYF